MSRATLYCGDVREVLATLPAESVQCVVTSPPYWGLRDYGAPGQLGLERTLEEYVAAMVAVFRGVRRVLRDDGTLWLNLGDSYTRAAEKGQHKPGDSGKQNYIIERGGGRAASQVSRVGSSDGGVGRGDRPGTRALVGGLKPKDLCGIPWLVAFALRAEGWYLRSEITWCKTAPMPESVTDRPTSATEKVFLLTKSADYFYDALAIAEPTVSGHGSGNGFKRDARLSFADENGARGNDEPWQLAPTKNARNWWVLNPEPYEGAHFAVMPTELARRCILAGSSAKACETCGAPWERQLERAYLGERNTSAGSGLQQIHRPGVSHDLYAIPSQTIGWQPTCACPTNTGGASSVVLDPFGGSGTTAAVAVGHGRQAIHIDLNPAYIELTRQRIGPMFVDEAEAVA